MVSITDNGHLLHHPDQPELFEVNVRRMLMLSERQRELFASFHQAIENEGILDQKTSHLIKIAAAMSFGCSP